ncbi:MAG: FAD-dependent oxidoreductase [archaeon]|nr:FAD-dependent oxidoreductase [archaeon]
MKLIVIGGNPAGLSAASAVRRANPDWEIEVYEMGGYISYGSCGLPYYIGGIVESSNKLITITKEDFLEKRNIPIYIFHKVISVDFEDKTVTVQNIKENKRIKKKYDYLMIATGGKSKITKNLDLEHPRVFKIHTISDAKKIKKALIGKKIKSGILVGAGYISLETLEAYKQIGILNLTIIGPRLVFRSKTQEYIKKELEKNGIKMILDSYVEKIESISGEKLKVTVNNGVELESDFVQIAIGVVPNTDIFKDSDLEMIKGAIVTDEYMKTNIENVYAAGDCCTVYHRLLKKKTYIPLAPAANKQGKIAGQIISGLKVDPYQGIVGTSIFKVFDLYCSKTGITFEEAKKLGYEAETILINNNEIAHYYPNKGKMTVLLVFDIKTHLLLGGEITAPTPLGAKKIDVLATALFMKMKIEDLQKLDLAYAPPFAPVWDPLLIAANIARKKLI